MPPKKHKKNGTEESQVRYAVVGLGYIAQAAVLPAFKNAKENSRLKALVSDDPEKLTELSKRYKVEHTYSYDEYDQCLQSGEIDAVYIALPNSMHADYTIRAAEHGIHILCEKPMAVTVEECERMIRAAEVNDVRLMIAYRLHFEAANLSAIDIVESGKIGEPRIFSSQFTMQVEAGNIRVRTDVGGGTLYDIGIYCINAARYIFRDEPEEVFAWTANNGEPRFAEVEEMTAGMMRFPGERLATFVCSFGASDVASFRVIGTKGDLCVEPAYEYAMDLKHYLTVNEKTKEKVFKKRDQFAPELIYFSNCVREGRDPEPSGEEGLMDVRIIQAMYESAQTGRPVRIEHVETDRHPTPEQQIKKPPVRKPQLVHAAAPSGET